jgi:hypothetical protein
VLLCADRSPRAIDHDDCARVHGGTGDDHTGDEFGA